MSDHEIWPDLRSRPRPQKRSLTPRCPCLSRSRRSPRRDRRSPTKARAICTVLHRPSHSIVRFAVARSRRSALLRPRMRAAGGLDRAIREPVEGNYRRPSREPLDDARRRRYCRILVDGCDPQPLHIARCGALRIGGLRPRFVSSLDSLPGRRLARRHVRGSKRSERTALRPQARAPDPSTLQIRHRHAATARRLSVVDASGAALSAAHPLQNEQRETGIDVQAWAGVSWPNDDGIGASGGDNIDRTLARTRTTRVDAQCDEPLRAFVRALARQAARELLRGATDAPLRRDSLRHASMKVAIYARYSSDNQRDASIADQMRVCRAFAERQGWTIAQEYSDHAVSGATLLRSGFRR